MNAKEFLYKLEKGKIDVGNFTKKEIGEIEVHKPLIEPIIGKDKQEYKFEFTICLYQGEISFKVYTYDEEGGYNALYIRPSNIGRLFSTLKLYNNTRFNNLMALLDYLKTNLGVCYYYLNDTVLKDDSAGIISSTADSIEEEENKIF